MSQSAENRKIPPWLTRELTKAKQANCDFEDCGLLEPGVETAWDEMAGKVTGDRVRVWPVGTVNCHELRYCILRPLKTSLTSEPRSNAISLATLFLPHSEATLGVGFDGDMGPRRVHEGAVASVMDTALGFCSSHHGQGGPTLALKLAFHQPLLYTSGASAVMFDAFVDRVDGKKVHLSGHVRDEQGEILVTAQALWRNFLQEGKNVTGTKNVNDDQKLHNKDSVRKNNAQARLQFWRHQLTRIVKAKPIPTYIINASIAHEGRVKDVFQPVDWVTALSERCVDDTQAVMVAGNSGMDKKIPHYVRSSGKLRVRYFWPNSEISENKHTGTVPRKFFSCVQFTEWCQGPPGNVQGGAIFSGHADACEAALLVRARELLQVDDDRYSGGARLVSVLVNYRAFTPLDTTYRFEVSVAPENSSSSSAADVVQLISKCFSPAAGTADEILHSDATIALSFSPFLATTATRLPDKSFL